MATICPGYAKLPRIQPTDDRKRRQQVIKQRWALALVLLGIELVLVQNVPGRLWEWLS